VNINSPLVRLNIVPSPLFVYRAQRLPEWQAVRFFLFTAHIACPSGTLCAFSVTFA
jgi:hypothetical protein